MSWRQSSICSEVTRDQQELFFSENAAELVLAQIICSGCPVVHECLIYALETGQPEGVWGMHRLEDRRWLARRLNRGKLDPALIWDSSFERIQLDISGRGQLCMDIEFTESPLITPV